MGTSPWGTPAQGPPGGGKRANTERGHHRQPVGQDDGKGGPRGYDAGKKVMGRKRHIIVDTIGLLLAVVVHPADIQDRDGAKLVINKLMGRFPRLRLIWADAGYAGRLVDWAQAWGAMSWQSSGVRGIAIASRCCHEDGSLNGRLRGWVGAVG